MSDRNTWKDVDGREWTFNLNAATVKLVRDETGVDLGKLVRDPDACVELAADIGRLVDVMSVALTPEIRRRGLDAEGFARCLGEPSVLESAGRALLWALCDTLPKNQSRVLRASLERAERKVVN